MHGSSPRALDVAVVSQVWSLLLHNDNMSNCCKKVRGQANDIANVRRCATIRMGSGGSVWAKPSATQCIACLTFKDLLRIALRHRFGSAVHGRWPVVFRREQSHLTTSVHDVTRE
eukprot:5366422-Amphidinium_carterae.1